MTTRMCISCRYKTEKKNLLRAVEDQNNVFFDFKQKIQQRAFYVCYDKRCILALKKRKKNIENSLKQLENYYDQIIKKIINISLATRKIFIGVDAVNSYTKKLVVFLSNDISLRSKNKIKQENKVFYNLNYNKFQLGDIVRKREVVALGVKGLSLDFNEVLSHYPNLFSQEN